MKIYDETKTHEIENPDLMRGWLRSDRIFVEDKEGNVVTRFPDGTEKRGYYEEVKVYVPFAAEDVENYRKEKRRKDRIPLLAAFDTYKTNVRYGIEIETEETYDLMIKWYKDLKDLNEIAFENVPDRISYYLY